VTPSDNGSGRFADAVQMIVRYTTDLVPGMVAKGLERQTTSDTQAHRQGTKKMEKHGWCLQAALSGADQCSIHCFC
jgi:hypothetical protein